MNHEKRRILSQIFMFNILIVTFVFSGCSDRSIYPESTPMSESWALWTGIVLGVELLIGLGICIWKRDSSTIESIVQIIGGGGVTFLLGYTVLAEWGFRSSMWLLGSVFGKIITVVLSLLGGIYAAVFGVIVNTFFWHSPEISKWAVLPALIGGVVYLIVLALKQNPRQPLEAENFYAAIDYELLEEGENLIEIFGLENLSHERQAEVIESARKVIDMRCLNHVLESLNEREKKDFANLLEREGAETVRNFLKSKNIDMTAILREEVLRFKTELVEELS